MSRLSSPIENMKDHYPVVVIGSGYGGGIAASRLARAGQRVCLLERGSEIRPGEYPDTVPEASEQSQLNTPHGRVGSRLGMFEFHVNKDINALVGCGLGGTSLINANVSLRAVPRLWEDPRWPEEIRADLDTQIEEGYRRAEVMLAPKPYPEDFPRLMKLAALEKSARALGDGDCFYRPPINVTFEDGPNVAGVEQRKCVLCGDCVTGCNYEAKNTTLMNYLPDACNHGAEIYTEVSVRHLERREGKWIVHYELLGQGRDKFQAPDLFVSADLVVVSAGTLGSSEILLRSKARGLKLSHRLGHSFTGNGDVLAFAYNCDEPIRGVGFGQHEPGELPEVGPCITGIVDLRDTDKVEDGFVIEEGSAPGALGPTLAAAFSAAAKAVGIDTDEGWVDKLKEKARAVDSLIRGPYHGAVNNSQTYLVMAHDSALGRLVLEDDRIRIEWPEVGKEPVFQVVNERLKEGTKPLGGVFVENPLWSELFDQSLVTVHPLGGCVLAADATRGVVNHKGQVFSGTEGNQVYDSLYVADGSVVPLSLGVNPLLTISALAERAMFLLAQDRGWTIDYTVPSVRRPTTPASQALGIKFTETMRGYFSTVVRDDYEKAEEQGKGAGSALEFTLTVAADDLDKFLDEPQHEATMVGTVSAAALSPEALVARNGAFNLFVEDSEEVSTRNMKYSMKLTSEEGKTYYFYGFKKINDSSVLELWPQTSTLYFTVYDGEDEKKPVLGKGILHIRPDDFLRQMTALKVTNAPTKKDQLSGLARFGKFFAGVLYESYGGVFVKPTYFNPDVEPRKKRPLRCDAPELHPLCTKDGQDLLLTRYRGGDKGPVLLVHGLGVSSLIFSTDLIATNLVEYLYANGYDVWLFDFRVSIALAASEEQSTGDQVATMDHPAAVEYVRRATGCDSIQTVVHCYGANTFFMAMLAGLEGVRSVVCSQVATHLVTPTLTKLKTGLHTAGFLDKLGIDSLTAYVDSHADWKSRLYDEALRLFPIPKDEACQSPVCHRVTFMYALLYEHAQLDQRIHDNLHELFGVGNLTAFEHLALMVRRQQVVAHDGADSYLPHLHRLALPICFIHGAENACYLPESTLLTHNLLAEANGGELYSRHVIPDYGHIDCIFGKNAADDVYPLILDHLEKT